MNFLKSGKSSAERDKYMLEVACELITGTQQEHYVSQAMEIGIQYESEARRAYFLRTGVDPKQTGFVLHPTLDYFGASPDGLLGKDGVLELKCPLPSTHWAYIRDGVVPDIYVPQVQAQMLCCERQYADFVSYCPPELYPDVPARFRLFIKRIEASPQLHRAMEDAVTTFMGEVAALVKKLDAACPELPKEADDDLGELGLTDADIAWAAGGFKKEEMP
jgi:putative phage-type endonuclease